MKEPKVFEITPVESKLEKEITKDLRIDRIMFPVEEAYIKFDEGYYDGISNDDIRLSLIKATDKELSKTISLLCSKNIELADKITNAKNYFIIHPDEDKFSPEMFEKIKMNPWIWFTNYCSIRITPDLAHILDDYENHRESLVGCENNDALKYFRYALIAYVALVRDENCWLLVDDVECLVLDQMRSVINIIKRFLKERFNYVSMKKGNVMLVGNMSNIKANPEYYEILNKLVNEGQLAIFMGNIDTMHHYHKNINDVINAYNKLDKTKSCKIATSELIIKDRKKKGVELQWEMKEWMNTQLSKK